MTDTVPGSDVTIKIGGETIAVPPMSFARLKQAWPAIRSLAEKPHVVAQAESAVEIVAAALQHVRPELDAAEIESRLIGREFLDLLNGTPHLLAASGLIPAEESDAGKSAPEPASPSGTTSSPSSSASASAVGTTSNAT